MLCRVLTVQSCKENEWNVAVSIVNGHNHTRFSCNYTGTSGQKIRHSDAHNTELFKLDLQIQIVQKMVDKRNVLWRLSHV